METVTTNSDTFVTNLNSVSSNPSSSSSSSSTTSFPIVRFLQAPVTTLFEYSGFLRPRSTNNDHESETLISVNSSGSSSTGGNNDGSSNEGEVSIRIIGDGEEEGERGGESGESVGIGGDGGGREREVADSSDVDGRNGSNNNDNNNNSESNQQRYDLQQVSRWIEQILPFSLLLIVVFIRQHLQGIHA